MNNIKGELSLGIAEFDKLINKNMIYVDKTPFIKQLLDHKKIYYFLSRPRRFGKTLFLSTLENFFKGKKELFKNTYIYDKWDWKNKYPIIRISMKQVSNENSEILKKDLQKLINRIAKENNIILDEDESYILQFGDLIKELSEKEDNNVVVLIDEYDAPILKNLNNASIADKNREVLQEFYNVLKESEKYLKFVFITGLSKFTKVSVFSTFNILTELSLNKDYSTICGITHQELENYYPKHIQFMADENNYTYKETINEFNHYYDGYSWDGINKVFNPYSTLNALDERKFKSFWFSTGTPSFIAEIFRKKKVTEDYFKPIELKETELDAIEPNNINETTLLFQAGYLTIEKEFTKNGEIYYSLKIPNFEVETAFKDNLTELYIDEAKQDFRILKKDMWDWIKTGDCDMLAKKLRIKFAKLSQELKLSKNNPGKWKFYSAIFLAWLDEMGMRFDGEKSIGQGVIDAVLIESDEHVAVIEIKFTEQEKKSLNSLINESLKQIHEKEYYLPYEDSNISLIALAFKDRPIKNGVITDVKCKIEKWNY